MAALDKWHQGILLELFMVVINPARQVKFGSALLAQENRDCVVPIRSYLHTNLVESITLKDAIEAVVKVVGVDKTVQSMPYVRRRITFLITASRSSILFTRDLVLERNREGRETFVMGELCIYNKEFKCGRPTGYRVT